MADVRMPTFGLDDGRWNAIIDYFEATGDSIGSFRTYDHTELTSMAGPGRELFDLLRCQQCHVLGAIPADQPVSNLAPDLRMTHERLKPEWILDWLRNPARIQPGTRMPQFWPTPPYPKSSFPQLGGDAEPQIRAIRDHLMTLRGGPSPGGPQGLAEYEMRPGKGGMGMRAESAECPAACSSPECPFQSGHPRGPI